MNLSLIRDFFTTVDEEWNSVIASQIASRWFSEPSSVKIMRASANFVALVTADDAHYTLRFNSEFLRPIETLQQEIRLLLSLRNLQIPVQIPVKSLDDNYVELIPTELGRFTAVLFRYIEGEIKEFDDLSDSDFLKWGRSLGILHQTLVDNQLARRFNLRTMVEQLKSCQPDSDLGSQEQSALLDWITELKISSETYGIIHYDFELDNIIWDNDSPNIIDFDDSAISWYIADLGFAMEEFFNQGGQSSDSKFHSFLNGYRGEKSIPESELKQLPGFLRLKNFLTYNELQRAVDLEKSGDHPDWLNQLITKLNEKRKELHQSFSDNPVKPLVLSDF